MKNLLKIIILTTILMLNISCSKERTEPGYEYMPDMVYSVAYEAFSESPLTANGSSMMFAPKGSIPRGYRPFLYGDSDEEKERAAKELTDPRPTSPVRIARGKYLYDISCLICHGEKGQGDGPLTKKYPEPPAFNSRALRDYKDGNFYYAIVKGFGDMPSHAAQLDDSDRWDVILYIHELQKME
jgi:mono/diheme cytochrome c family protein